MADVTIKVISIEENLGSFYARVEIQTGHLSTSELMFEVDGADVEQAKKATYQRLAVIGKEISEFAKKNQK